MTLRIQISQFAPNDPILSGLIAIQVRGSKSGAIVSKQEIAEDAIWDPPFLIQCHHHDKLELKVLSIQQEKIAVIGSSIFQSKKLIEDQQEDLAQKPIKQQIIVAKDEVQVGKLTAEISYDPTLIYEGQMPGRVNLSIRSQQHVLPFPIYVGKNQTVNAFSFLDESASAQRCIFNQSVYRDGK